MNAPRPKCPSVIMAMIYSIVFTTDVLAQLPGFQHVSTPNFDVDAPSPTASNNNEEGDGGGNNGWPQGNGRPKPCDPCNNCINVEMCSACCDNMDAPECSDCAHCSQCCACTIPNLIISDCKDGCSVDCAEKCSIQQCEKCDSDSVDAEACSKCGPCAVCNDSDGGEPSAEARTTSNRRVPARNRYLTTV